MGFVDESEKVKCKERRGIFLLISQIILMALLYFFCCFCT
jgi:hypothetical protein